MEREIIFRGRRLDNGEWVEGNYYESNMSGCFILQNVQKKTVNAITGVFSMRDIPIPYEVDPATVGQYTGLTDRDGKKIFEGDIVTTPKYGVDNGKGQNYSGKDKFVVGYSDGTYTLKNVLREFCLRPDSDAVVCGNIVDNPELLEVKR